MDHYDSREVAEKYHASFSEGTDNPATMQKAVDRFYKFLRNVPDSGHILDAGCGTGRIVKYSMVSLTSGLACSFSTADLFSASFLWKSDLSSLSLLGSW